MASRTTPCATMRPSAATAYSTRRLLKMFMSGALSDAFPLQSDLLIFKVLAPFCLFMNPYSFSHLLFDVEGGGLLLAQVDLPLWVAGVAILVVTLLTGVLALRRYRKHT